MVITDYITMSSNGNRDVIDVTSDVQDIVLKNNVEDGIAVVFVSGSTAALTTIEYEPGLIKDIDVLLEKLVPYSGNYKHHDTWHDDNGAAHLQSAMISPSITVPVIKGRLALGTWQQIVLIDCDTKPRDRRLIVQIIS